MKRGYLLSAGCKDLIDVLKQPPRPSSRPAARLMDLSNLKQPVDFLKLTKFKPAQSKPLPPNPTSLPPVIGGLVIPHQASASQLAALLGQKVFQIMADVMRLGFFTTPEQPLRFEIISRVARRYGFIAIKAA